MDSIWSREIELHKFPTLEQDLRTDVLVIGGGLAGLLCARELTRSGVDCTLIEQKQIMSGVSGRTTAKLTAQHGLIYGKLLKCLGREKAKLYWQANRDAVHALSELAKNVDCNYQTQSNFIYSTGSTEKLEAEMAAYQQLGIPAQWDNNLPLPFTVTGALRLADQAQFHPLKLAAYLSEGLKIYENTKALSFIGNQVQTPNGKISAEKIIIATHFPLLNKHGAFFLKLYQQRSYVLALENVASVEGMYLDCEENGLSIRGADKLLLLGGGGHRTGKQGLGWRLPEAIAEKYYSKARIVTRWATQDCMSLDGMPYIGLYSRTTPNLYVATGFQKWGMSSSMVAASLLTDLILGRENPYVEAFSPQRSIWHKQLLCNGAESTLNLLRPTTPRCPHLGCALKWNREEQSWDCPCHGSRFDKEGRLLDNPATDDLKHPPRTT